MSRFIIADEESVLQEISRVSLHQTVVVSIGGTSSALHEESER